MAAILAARVATTSPPFGFAGRADASGSLHTHHILALGIYAAAAYDTDVGDFGPYNSAVYKIGELTFHPEFWGFPMVEIYPEPTMFAEATRDDEMWPRDMRCWDRLLSPRKQVNGFKVEAVARADKVPVNMYYNGEASAVSGPMTFLGTDDENYGGTLRPINLTLADLEHDEL